MAYIFSLLIGSKENGAGGGLAEDLTEGIWHPAWTGRCDCTTGVTGLDREVGGLGRWAAGAW